MNPLIQLKKTTSLFVIALLVAFRLVPLAHAVIPPPDGGYPGGNTAEGENALLNLTSGTFNTAVGLISLRSNTDGDLNTAIGAGALLANNADGNTATGAAALLTNTGGSINTANGVFALFSNNSSGNTAVGANALRFNTSGFGNTALGSGAGISVTTANNVICIGASGADVDSSCFIGNIYPNVQPVVGTDPDHVTISSSGRLGRANISSRRYKHDIQPMEEASEVIFALKPVSFRYNKQYDATQTLAFGLIAEDVAEIAPDLVGRNPRGEPESVRYEQLNAMLLNEFLKAHGKIEEQEAAITRLQKQIEALTACLQKVSSVLELPKAPQVVATNP
jgi:Chaperone of endosialidase